MRDIFSFFLSCFLPLNMLGNVIKLQRNKKEGKHSEADWHICMLILFFPDSAGFSLEDALHSGKSWTKPGFFF